MTMGAAVQTNENQERHLPDAPMSFGMQESIAIATQLLEADSPQSLLLSYLVNNPATRPRICTQLFKIFKGVCDVGHNLFPRQIKSLIVGKDMLDFGCGNTLYGAAFRALGARSYVGVDPQVDISRRRFRSRQFKTSIKLDVSLEDVLARIPDVEYYRDDSILENSTFDIIVLRTVTEHIIDLKGTFARLERALRPGGQIWFLHTNFYSWAGHNQEPRSVKTVDMTNPDHQQYGDWAHIGLTPPNDHPLSTQLNRIRLNDLRAVTEQHFEIVEWTPIEDSKGVKARLTPAIEKASKGFSRDELLTSQVICLAEKRG